MRTRGSGAAGPKQKKAPLLGGGGSGGMGTNSYGLPTRMKPAHSQGDSCSTTPSIVMPPLRN